MQFFVVVNSIQGKVCFPERSMAHDRLCEAIFLFASVFMISGNYYLGPRDERGQARYSGQRSFCH